METKKYKVKLNNVDKIEDPSYFSGEFHERDKLSENNIVEEVKKSFLDYYFPLSILLYLLYSICHFELFSLFNTNSCFRLH